MPAVATIEELRGVAEAMQRIREAHPEAFEMVVSAFKHHRAVGYKNLCKIMMGEATPEKLKGIE